ncbi:hypothetical protein ASPTUDRAFT_112521 [Aspergillus tubingensis CBS 134.48]|uniref:Cytochrome P450 monooxygenase n=1 Tax=Aspergillus tubingensis (strain CBS 134.48) TaxID=767770 RepID=A0A1L9NL26_ASPTC|nr:hypothetical protein ASPTUDRAFT_112521 [Aspergillus tubingensis CBS 134.48]
MLCLGGQRTAFTCCDTSLINLQLLFTVLYRLFFHPLSKYPGPRLAAITSWYAAFYAWRGDLHLQIDAWHKRYGKFVRYSPNSICANSATAVFDIYGARANVRKADGYETLSASRIPNTLTTNDKQMHRFKRRILGQVYSENGVKDILDPILSNIRDFVQLLNYSRGGEPTEWGPVHNMAIVCDWLTLDVITCLCYGSDKRLMKEVNFRWCPSAIAKTVQRAMMCITQPKVFKYKLDRLLLASYRKEFQAFTTWVYDSARNRERIGDDLKQKDIFYALKSTKDPKTGKGFTMKEIWVECALLLAAASDTTSTAMSATFFYLLHNPEALSKVTTEVRSCFANEEDISMGSRLSSCVYLNACINESMRLTPPVANTIPRYVQTGGNIVDGEHFPQGVNVGTAVYTLHRNEAYFRQPHRFYPERWIVNPDLGIDEDCVRLAQRAFHPFSYGSRSCIGWRLAWTELTVTIARTLFVYDAQLAPGSPCCQQKTSERKECQYELKSWVTSSVDGPLVQFRPRQG